MDVERRYLLVVSATDDEVCKSGQKHGSDERSFLLETTAQGATSNQQAWHLSLGLRAAADPTQINVQLFTVTLRPAAQPGAAPTQISQGPFDFLVDRKLLLDQWTHVAFTFDSGSLRLFINGEAAANHQLDIRGPAAEFGGLVIGGHRAGTGSAAAIRARPGGGMRPAQLVPMTAAISRGATRIPAPAIG